MVFISEYKISQTISVHETPSGYIPLAIITIEPIMPLDKFLFQPFYLFERKTKLTKMFPHYFQLYPVLTNLIEYYF